MFSFREAVQPSVQLTGLVTQMNDSSRKIALMILIGSQVHPLHNVGGAFLFPKYTRKCSLDATGCAGSYSNSFSRILKSTVKLKVPLIIWHFLILFESYALVFRLLIACRSVAPLETVTMASSEVKIAISFLILCVFNSHRFSKPVLMSMFLTGK